jgi:hypothetical protein
MVDYIYYLSEPGRQPFYVGRTSNMARRLKEHQYASKTGTEAKYQYIRNLNGKPWEMVLLEEVGPDTKNYEQFWIYNFIINGVELQNMMAGSAKQQAERDAMLYMKGKEMRFTSAKEFLSERERIIKEEKARKKAEILNSKIKKPHNTEPAVFIDDLNLKTISPALQAIMDRLNIKRK